jgi:hypothetical protein
MVWISFQNGREQLFRFRLFPKSQLCLRHQKRRGDFLSLLQIIIVGSDVAK